MAIPRFLFSFFASKSLSSFYLFCFFNFHRRGQQASRPAMPIPVGPAHKEYQNRSENRHSKNIQNASEVKKNSQIYFCTSIIVFFLKIINSSLSYMAKKVFVNFQFMIFFMCPLTLKNALKTLIRSVCFCLDFSRNQGNQGCFKPARRAGTAAFMALLLWPAGALFGFLKFYFKCFI